MVNPTVTTSSPATSITKNSAVVSGNITDTGAWDPWDPGCFYRGVCYNTTGNPTLGDSKVWEYQLYWETGPFSMSLTGLSPSTIYYCKAFAVNESGYGYGAEISFTTLTEEGGEPPPPTYAPTVTTDGITGISASGATGGGNVTSAGSGTVSARGVCWNTNGSPTIADDKTTDGSGTGVFVSTLAGLTAPTTYYVRAYATSEYGTAYGAEVSFQTLSPPTVTTTSPASKIKASTAIVRGDIVATGGADATERGVCYNTTGSPTTADSKVSEAGTFSTGPFSISLTSLSKNTTYYARAYAINSESTSYGAAITFLTLSIDTAAEALPRLMDTFYLPRAGRYADPMNTNDCLQLVYGDLTDGANGNWKLPCIDTVNNVYCFAGCEVLSVANGNTVTIYENGMEMDPGDYTFDAADDYEGEGVIATITFSTPKANAVITATGKGKPTASGGATLMENIIDQVVDVLTIQNNYTIDLFESTAKARARNIFEGRNYTAAGVINEDMVFWDVVIEMMSSFLGSAYLNGTGELILEIDDGSASLYGATIIRKGESILTDARMRLANIINQCPAHYAYNYASEAFKHLTNTSAHADAISQSIHGVREPNEPLQLYWCRNITDAQAIQGIIVARLKDPIYEIEIENITLKHLQLDVGDYFVNSVDSLYGKDGLPLNNNYWRIVSVRPDYAKAKINFRALQAPHYLTMAYLLDGSWDFDGAYKCGADRETVTY